jgi:hypothetical protein
LPRVCWSVANQGGAVDDLALDVRERDGRAVADGDSVAPIEAKFFELARQ